MRRLVHTVVLVGGALGLSFGAVAGLLTEDIGAGLLVAVTSALVIGVVLGLHGWWSHPDLGEERLLREGGANRWLWSNRWFWHGWEAVGGWMYLTDSRLLFVCHAANVQRHRFSLPLADVVDVRTTKTFGVFRNGLSVDTVSGQAVMLVTWNRAAWARDIKSACVNEQRRRRCRPSG